MKIRIATRSSKLALTQMRAFAATFRALDPAIEIEEVPLVTEGDRVLDRPLAAIGGKGLFVSEVEAALVDGRADIAVHSLKDVPTALADGLVLACIPEREDPRDALVTIEGLELDAIPPGSKIGTSSLRRHCQLRARRPDLAFASLRGNVDTRLKRLEEGKFAGIVLALAGLRRLGLHERPLWVVPIDVSIPAIGQGALAIEARKDDAKVRALLAKLEHEPTRLAIEAERAFLAKLEGSCRTPLAAHASFSEGRFTIEAMVGSIDGDRILSGGGDRVLNERTREARIEAAQRLGTEVAEGLIGKGAMEMIREAVAHAERAEHTGNGGGKPHGYKAPS